MSLDPKAYGVKIFHGCPGSGKTSGAYASVLRFRLGSGDPKIPVLILDPQRAYNFARVPEWSDGSPLPSLWSRLWRDRAVVKVTPRDEDSFDRIIGGAVRGGDLLIIVDEFRFYANSHYVSRALSLACRQYRHNRIGLYLTTQHLSDCHAEITSCMTEIYHFRTVSPRILHRLRTEYGIDPANVRNLGVGECLMQTGGFNHAENSRR